MSSITTIKDMELSPNTDKIIFVTGDTKLYSISFPYNNIAEATTIEEKDFTIPEPEPEPEPEPGPEETPSEETPSEDPEPVEQYEFNAI
jgi:hypothetical protein